MCGSRVSSISVLSYTVNGRHTGDIGLVLPQSPSPKVIVAVYAGKQVLKQNLSAVEM